MDVGDGVRPIGRRLRQIRQARRKSLRVVAGLAGISASHLYRIETGARPLDSLTLILVLADALQVAPSELVTLPVPAPGNGPTMVGAALPGLIRDLHTSIAAGRDVAELLDLAVLLHSHATVGWLRVVGGSLDLRSQGAELPRRAATERDTPQALGLAAWGGMYVLVMAGAVDLAHAELNAVRVPTTSPESAQLAGMLALCQAFLAMAESRLGDVAAPLEFASELAQRTGEVNAYGLGFGPQEVGQWRARTAMEVADHEQAARVAEGLVVQTHPLRSRQGDYWVTYGRALARLGRPGAAGDGLPSRSAGVARPGACFWLATPPC